MVSPPVSPKVGPDRDDTDHGRGLNADWPAGVRLRRKEGQSDSNRSGRVVMGGQEGDGCGAQADRDVRSGVVRGSHGGEDRQSDDACHSEG